ncbi:hypothetical protein QBC33DRAFT_568434 [Phialemonium atrogriseum]|uniref:RRM domain-containing protein n=1 Tax=Phialemonium atrogriseum TaxID=1093897 RepID=A0AAJ0C258_9PEZI|nr:uncharacterized protein QBC33DRAFT_568434 [Phialemonium atrogriseum]KAK1768759.1 hypothetical protein QBC33DRAFT_568434 [Phialemonium atrogriseum]
MGSLVSPQATPKGRELQFLPKSASTSSSSDEDNDDAGGVRLTDLDFDDSPIQASVVRSNKEVVEHVGIPDTTGETITFTLSKPKDDIFVSPIKEHKYVSPVKERKFVSPERKLRRVTGTINGARRLGSGHIVPSLEDVVKPTPPLRYRSSDISGAQHQPAEVDAQGVYPQSACVFVANLPENKDDVALEAALTREFCNYGTVFVKIRRDNHNMPFAFCQYTNDSDAKLGMERGRGTMIFGRACRTEMVKANRTFTISRRDGRRVTVGQAFALMQPHGELDKCETSTNLTPDGVPSVTVHFKMYDPSRDLVAAFQTHEEYRVVAAFDPADKSKLRPKNSNEAFMARYDIDRRSVFVDGLTAELGKDELMALFEEVGQVLDCQIIHKTISSGTRIYGFVEYAQIDMPERAVKKFTGIEFHGKTLRVERKMGKQPNRMPRRVQSQQLPTYKSVGNSSSAGLTDGHRNGPIVPRRNVTVFPSNGAPAVADGSAATPSTVMVPTRGAPAGDVGAAATPGPFQVPITGPANVTVPGTTGITHAVQTPVPGPPAFGFPHMGYGAPPGFPNPYFASTPQVPPSPMSPWVYSPYMPFYPFPSPAAVGFPTGISGEDATEKDGEGQDGKEPAAKK